VSICARGERPRLRRRVVRVVVPRLQPRGYSVMSREVEGGDEMPPAIAKEGAL
jgi:hypothetical protein